MLRKLLNGHIVCEPLVEGWKAGYCFTASGTFDRLLTGVKVVNEFNGGHVANSPLLPRHMSRSGKATSGAHFALHHSYGIGRALRYGSLCGIYRFQ